MKGLHGGIPIAVLAAVARAQVDVIGGSDGFDSGNAGGVITENDFGRAAHEVNKDDHHVDINTKTKVDVDYDAYPDPYWHHWHPDGRPHWRRGHGGDTTVIGGPNGIDTGNDAALPTKNEAVSSVKETNLDDHSDHLKASANVDVNSPWQHWKRQPSRWNPPATVIDGPGGIDTGNSASLPTTNKFASFYKEHNKDDHSVDIDQKFKYDYDVHGHPYPVPVPAHPWKRDPSHHHPPATVIDGPGGIDTGNSASLPTTNKFASFYKEHNKDDHSVDIDQKFKYDYDVHGHPYPVPVPAHPWKRDPSRSHPPATVIDGPGGINSGNAAASPTKNELGLAYSETNIDDHSVDIDQKTNVDVDNHWDYPVPVPAYPHHPHWPHHLKARQFGNTVIDGPGGVDRGSDAAIPTKNGFAFGYSETNIDDHSVDIDTKTDVDIDTDFHAVPYPVHYHPHPHHFHGRGLGDTVIDGPGGVDSGNGFSAPTDNEFASFYDETNLDDHSFTGKAAADVDIDNHYPYPYPYPVPAHIHHWKARAHPFVPPWKDVTLIDGPGGIDTGNDADLSTTNTFLSDYDEFNQDDHSFTGKSAADVDVDTHVPYPVPVPAPGHPHHWKARGHHEPPVTVIGGPSGIDTGNSADLSSVNTAISDYDEFNRDDHSFDAKAKADYDLHYRRSVHARQFGTDVIDGPGGIDSGNGFSAPTSNHAVAGYSEYNEDDHSVDIDSKTDVDIDGHFHPVPLPHPVPAPHPVPVPHHHEHPGPGPFHEPPAAPAPAPVEAPTGDVHVPQEALKPNPAPEPVVQHNPQGEETYQAPPSGEVHAPVPEYNPQPLSPQTESFEPAVHSEPAPPTLNVPNTPNTPSDNKESDFFQPIVHSTPEAPAPSVPSVNENSYQPAPPAAHNFESQAAPSTSLVHAAQTQPDPVFHGMAIPSSTVAHVALASTVTVPQASSFAKIPVYVPQSSAVVPAAHGPASSTVVVHPTGVAASTPSSASSSAAIASRADTVFTGGVAHLTPHAGVFSIVCGVVGLLAFVL